MLTRSQRWLTPCQCMGACAQLKEDFYKHCNDYAATEEEVLALRARDYPLLEANSIVYLDYTGSGLAASKQAGPPAALLWVVGLLARCLSSSACVMAIFSRSTGRMFPIRSRPWSD